VTIEGTSQRIAQRLWLVRDRIAETNEGLGARRRGVGHDQPAAWRGCGTERQAGRSISASRPDRLRDDGHQSDERHEGGACGIGRAATRAGGCWHLRCLSPMVHRTRARVVVSAGAAQSSRLARDFHADGHGRSAERRELAEQPAVSEPPHASSKTRHARPSSLAERVVIFHFGQSKSSSPSHISVGRWRSPNYPTVSGDSRLSVNRSMSPSSGGGRLPHACSTTKSGPATPRASEPPMSTSARACAPAI
jgi:hypothetical protein